MLTHVSHAEPGGSESMLMKNPPNRISSMRKSGVMASAMEVVGAIDDVKKARP